MRYHFVVNGYSKDCKKQMQEQQGFCQKYLSDIEEGESIIYGKEEVLAELNCHHTEEAVLITASDYVPEAFLTEFSRIIQKDDLYIFGSDFSGNELAVRAAARKGGTSAASVHALSAEHGLSVKKMVYSNHMEGTFSLGQGPYCISLAKGLEKAPLKEGAFQIISKTESKEGAGHILEREFFPEEEKGLEDARVVVAAGRGIRKKENMELIQKTADSLGGEYGISRPAAMNAWGPMNRLIGVSGAMLSPDICITAGVSGAAAFYAGIEKSEFIAAINKDEKAPIMRMADVAVADDFEPVLEELQNIIEENGR